MNEFNYDCMVNSGGERFVVFNKTKYTRSKAVEIGAKELGLKYKDVICRHGYVRWCLGTMKEGDKPFNTRRCTFVNDMNDTIDPRKIPVLVIIKQKE